MQLGYFHQEMVALAQSLEFSDESEAISLSEVDQYKGTFASHVSALVKAAKKLTLLPRKLLKIGVH